MTLHEFLEALYGKVTEGYIGVSVMPTKDSIPKTTFFTKDQLSEMEAFVLESGKTAHTHIGLNPRKRKLDIYQRGTSKDVGCVVCIGADFDIFGPAHTEKELPKTKEELLEFIGSFQSNRRFWFLPDMAFMPTGSLICPSISQAVQSFPI